VLPTWLKPKRLRAKVGAVERVEATPVAEHETVPRRERVVRPASRKPESGARGEVEHLVLDRVSRHLFLRRFVVSDDRVCSGGEGGCVSHLFEADRGGHFCKVGVHEARVRQRNHHCDHGWRGGEEGKEAKKTAVVGKGLCSRTSTRIDSGARTRTIAAKARVEGGRDALSGVDGHAQPHQGPVRLLRRKRSGFPARYGADAPHDCAEDVIRRELDVPEPAAAEPRRALRLCELQGGAREPEAAPRDGAFAEPERGVHRAGEEHLAQGELAEVLREAAERRGWGVGERACRSVALVCRVAQPHALVVHEAVEEREAHDRHGLSRARDVLSDGRLGSKLRRRARDEPTALDHLLAHGGPLRTVQLVRGERNKQERKGC